MPVLESKDGNRTKCVIDFVSAHFGDETIFYWKSRRHVTCPNAPQRASRQWVTTISYWDGIEKDVSAHLSNWPPLRDRLTMLVIGMRTAGSTWFKKPSRNGIRIAVC